MRVGSSVTGRWDRAVLIDSGARIRQAVTQLNALPLAQFYSSFGCFSDGSLVSLTFCARRTQPLATATIYPGACTVIGLRINARVEPSLGAAWFPGSGIPRSEAARFMAQLSAILGVSLPNGLRA